MNKSLILLISFLFLLGTPLALGAGTMESSHPEWGHIYSLDYLHTNTNINVSYTFGDGRLMNAYYLVIDLECAEIDSDDYGNIVYQYTTDLFGNWEYNATMDGDGDGILEFYDDGIYQCIMDNYGGACGGCICDLNGDGQITTNDISYASISPHTTRYFNFSVNWTSYPFDNAQYYLNWSLYNQSDVLKETGSAGFWHAGSTDHYDYHFSVMECDPRHLDYYANIPRDGSTFKVLSNVDESQVIDLVTAWWGDNPWTLAEVEYRQLQGYGSRLVYYKSLDNEPLWTLYLHNGDTFKANYPYYVYFGVRFGYLDPYTAENTYFTIMDASAYRTNFSVEKIADPWHVHQDHSKYFKWIGVGRYFETNTNDNDNPLSGWQAYTPRPEADSFGDMIDDWATDPVTWGGDPPMPWFKTLVGIIVCVISICIPLGFSIRYDVDIPNFIYGIALTVGMFGAFALDLFELWHVATYLIVVIFTIVYMYRETLFQAVSLEQTKEGLELQEKALPKSTRKMSLSEQYTKTGKLPKGIVRWTEPHKKTQNVSKKQKPLIPYMRPKQKVRWSPKGIGSGYSKASGYATASDAHINWLKRNRGKK